jgi:hypothetical protein|tara:strand:- start:504 stop:677 length:174 start_codon:yes stop_codon:yes gene_type:complete
VSWKGTYSPSKNIELSTSLKEDYNTSYPLARDIHKIYNIILHLNGYRWGVVGNFAAI